MGKHILRDGQITAFGKYLHGEERSAGTIANHLRHTRAFSVWLNGRAVTRAAVAEWKEMLVSHGYAPASVNAMLAAVQPLFQFLGWNDCRVKYLTVQKRLFRDRDRELTRDDYRRLLETAVSTGRERLALVLETMYATGIRVSELCYITVEALRCGQAEISLKGKIRVILLPAKLCRKLLKYAQKNCPPESACSGGLRSLARFFLRPYALPFSPDLRLGLPDHLHQGKLHIPPCCGRRYSLTTCRRAARRAAPYSTQDQIDRANQASLASFPQSQGGQLTRTGQEYRWKRHDSLTVRGSKRCRKHRSKFPFRSATPQHRRERR